MKSFNHIDLYPARLPLSADDVLEFHAARLLLLALFCGTSNRIDGLTKMAKLDFFVRYPNFFAEAVRRMGSRGTKAAISDPTPRAIEAAMIRHRYGPWDKRYYHVLAYLEAKQLIAVTKRGTSYEIALTHSGHAQANALAARSSFAPMVKHMRDVKKAFGTKTGTAMKNLIYELFDAEIKQRSLGEVIG